MEQLLEKTIACVRAAGEIVRGGSRELSVEEKGFANYVTNIDLAVQSALNRALRELEPEAEFISEENETNEYATRKAKWILDPIDGTTNLIHGYPHVAISVAYVGPDRRFGIVYNPFNDELFTALSDSGAWLNGERLSVSRNDEAQACIFGFGFPYDRKVSAPTMFRAAEKVFSACQDLKRKGPASLDLAYVAAGRIDGYFELDLNVWDVAAGLILLEEAGGRATDWEGKPIQSAMARIDLIATNGLVHEELRALVRSAG
ncbi:inositol monophosphatase family protein [Cohnella hongkongensis]|uniref:Inositol-1-monophosphatase n=1 Tax=Cohnella hongkongensis TaxID=178337 RepID=A0ABV9F4W4_9BACL